MATSIFDLERRFDFDISYRRLINVTKEKIYSERGYVHKHMLWDNINEHIRNWKYRFGANNYLEYFEDIGITSIENPNNDEEKMYVMEFLANMIVFLIEDEDFYEKEDLDSYENITLTIDYMLERLNFTRYESNGQIRFTKRDADVDSILPGLKSNEDLRICLLEYNDYRNSNLESKKRILFRIGEWLEPKRDEFNDINHNLTDDVFYVLNNFRIRHNNNKQIVLSEIETLEIYDKLFKMIIHLLREQENIKFHNDLKIYKNI